MIKGVPKFDGVAVGEISVSFLGEGRRIAAKAAFVHSTTGKTHGWTENSAWSQTTIDKLLELRNAMEVDLARLHLEGDPTGAESATTSQGLSLSGNPLPEGIGEAARSGSDAPSV